VEWSSKYYAVFVNNEFKLDLKFSSEYIPFVKLCKL